MYTSSLIKKSIAFIILLSFIGTSSISITMLTSMASLNQKEEAIPEISSVIREQGLVWLSTPVDTQKTEKQSFLTDTDIEWLTYGGENYLSLGLVGGSYPPWEGAIRLTPEELAPYDGWRITSVKYFHGYQSNPDPEPPSHGNMKIYAAGNATNPGVLLNSEPFWTPEGNAWFQFNLFNPVVLNASQDYWYSIEIIDQHPGEYLLGIDSGPAVFGKGDFCELIEGSWMELQQYGWCNNWNHMVGLEPINILLPPVVHGPTSGWTDTAYTFWIDPFMNPGEDSFYIKWDWGDGTITEWFGPYPSGSNVSASYTWLCSGTYHVRAKLVCNENASDWSEPHTITVIENEPPISPIISGPQYGRVGVSYNFSMNTIDPEGDDFFYFVSWGDGNFTGWIGPYASDQCVIFSHAWNEPGTYSIKVKLKDTYGSESDWSEFIIMIVRLKLAFFIGTIENMTQTDDLIILQARSFIIFPANPIYIYGWTVVLAKENLGFINPSFAIGIGRIAIPSLWYTPRIYFYRGIYY